MKINDPRSLSTGVYEIVCLDTGKSYIGSSQVSFYARCGQHRRELTQGAAGGKRHHCNYLQNAWVKYGPEKFEFRILEACARSECLPLEQKYIDERWGLGTLFNCTPKATGGAGPCSEETKKKLSIAHTGKIRSVEHRQALSVALTGKKHLLSSRLKMSESHNAMSSEAYARMIAKQATAKRGKPGPMLGRKHSAETRSLLSSKLRGRPGRPTSDESKAKISAANSGKSPSAEAREKMAAAKRGRVASPETRAKMSAARLGRKDTPETKLNRIEVWKRRKEKNREDKCV